MPLSLIRSAAVLLAGVGLVVAQGIPGTDPRGPEKSRATGPSAAAQTQDTTLLREGTELADQLGSFRSTGDRLTFLVADGSRRLVCLENLNLERIARAITESPAELQWAVTGKITEFRGANYLLVERATLFAGSKKGN